jgi:hypothetical protein
MKVIKDERRGRANTIASSGRLNLIALALLLGGAFGAIASPPVRTHAAGAFFEVAAGEIINTVAGGGYGSSVPVRQAPVGEPRLMARDPQGRGFYLIDNRNETYLLRFINTSTNPVTLAGATIQPGQIGLVAGGGTVLEDNIAAREFDLGQIEGLAVDATGNIVYLLAPLEAAVYALNVSAGPVNARGWRAGWPSRRTAMPTRPIISASGNPPTA